MSERNERSVDADRSEDAFDRVLTEAFSGEEPPDLVQRVLASSADERARAFANVHRPPESRLRRLAAFAAALLVLAVVVGVFASRGERNEAALAQDPALEVEIASAAALAAYLPRVHAIELVARLDATGRRLSDAPEHTGVLADTALRTELLQALSNVAVVGDPLPSERAECELRLCAGTSFARARLHFDRESASLGFRSFSLPEVVQVALATTLRGQWQELAQKEPPSRRRVAVDDLRQLIAAIGSDRTIDLVGGPYVLTAGDDKGDFPTNPHVRFDTEWGTERMIVEGVRNLHVRAVGAPVHVLSRSPSDVLVLLDCTGIVLEGLVLGHVEGLALHCVAPVLRCTKSRDVTLTGCELFGCGTEAVVADTVENFRLDRCDVHTCRHGVLVFENARKLSFRGTLFRDCSMFGEGFRFDRCEDVTFADCAIRRMDGGVSGEPECVDLFAVRMDEPVRFVGGEIVQNRCRSLANSKLLLDLQKVTLRDNGPKVDPAPK